MKEIKLISMRAFVYTINEMDFSSGSEYRHYFTDTVTNYANFLTQPLELGMFIPCVNGVPIEEPNEPEAPYDDKLCDVWNQYTLYLSRYQQAKEKVLFEGVLDFFTIQHQGDSRFYTLEGTQVFNSDPKIKDVYFQYHTIEDMLGDFNPTLTQSAIKKLGI